MKIELHDGSVVSVSFGYDNKHTKISDGVTFSQEGVMWLELKDGYKVIHKSEIRSYHNKRHAKSQKEEMIQVLDAVKGALLKAFDDFKIEE